ASRCRRVVMSQTGERWRLRRRASSHRRRDGGGTSATSSAHSGSGSARRRSRRSRASGFGQSIMIEATLAKLHARLAALCGHGRPRAVSAALVQGDAIVDRWAAGRIDDAPGSAKVDTGSRFLAASLTKPVTAAAFMRLVEGGEIGLATPVSRVLPQFTGGGKEGIEVRHLLTHSSGLPDMVAENVALRERQAGLPEFFDCVCRAPLLFAPGEGVAYQSMGILVLAMLVERIAGESFRGF